MGCRHSTPVRRRTDARSPQRATTMRDAPTAEMAGATDGRRLACATATATSGGAPCRSRPSFRRCLWRTRHRPRRSERQRRDPPLPHEPAQARHRPRRPDRRRRSPPLPHEPEQTRHRRRRVTATEFEARDGHEPPRPPKSSGVPRRRHHGCTGGTVLSAYSGPVDDIDAEHGDHGEDDGVHPRDGARGRDPRTRRSRVTGTNSPLVLSGDGDYRGAPLLLEDFGDRLPEHEWHGDR